MRSLTEIPFEAVEQEVKELNSSLYDAIGEIPHSERPPLFLAQYQYGDNIINRQGLLVPNKKGTLTPLSDFKAKDSVYKLLSYSNIPISMVLHKQCEVFVENPQHIIPLNCIEPGECFGLFESLTTKKTLAPTWRISAGARSLFMLPKITDTKHFAAIKHKYGITTTLPQWLSGQAALFSQLAERAGETWHSNVLFFTKDWLKRKSGHWLPFRNFLLESAWSQTQYLRDEHNHSFVWGQLMAEISKAKLKPSPYQLETVKHLISIQLGAYPGFSPAKRTDDNAGPIETLQDIYVNDYKLADSLPILMQPKLYRKHHNSAIYYSLGYPTMPTGNHLKNPRGIIQELHEVREIVNLLKKVTNTYGNKHTPPVFANPELRFFHLNEAPGIKAFSTLPDHDPAFLDTQHIYKHLKFPSYSTFARGCIQINPL